MRRPGGPGRLAFTPFSVAVTGGTGAYQNVGGQLTLERTLPGTTTDVETLRLIFFDTD